MEVIRSTRRRKTVEARMVGAVMQLSIPARMSKGEEQHWIEVMWKRLSRRRAGEEVDLQARARRIARRHGLPVPTSIRWVDNQQQRWGSCTPARGTIRLSSRMVDFPAFVVDHVILHELAHLVHADHGPAFQAIIDQDPLKERVTGYLMAKAHDGDGGGDFGSLDDIEGGEAGGAETDGRDLDDPMSGRPTHKEAVAVGVPAGDRGVHAAEGAPIDLVDDGSGQLRIA